ncbi:extensin-like domain-containing protein [Chelativorans intermedius]|uniref:Extensin family protein n=1 Tax=Chelativorans intermedius TaxID=515947 RepID=A0ABV6D372_9HYPH|nr:extensin family protein [Chelativorans intermedius]MCT8998426.1 extensin family protein [Chelativorans intermedius]
MSPRRRPLRASRLLRSLIGLGLAGVLAACSAEAVLRPEVDVGVRTAAVSGGGLQNLVPSNPMMTSYPRFTMPRDPAAAMPADEAACRRELKRLGVTYRDLAPIDDGGACRIDHPVEVSALSGGIKMQPPATLNCRMAATFARWTKNELAPAARMRYLSGIDTIRQGSSYSCRRIRGTGVASEHSKGNALDVMSITLNNGREIDVRRPGFFAFRQRGLLNKVRAQGCGYFTTVLGPGYDADHADHFHFDIKERKNGYRACR